MFPTGRSFPSSKATAPGRTSGGPASVVFDAAVAKAYGGKRQIEWKEVLAGEKAFNQTGNWLPDETLDAFRKLPRRHQGPAHHARRRRHPLAQRRAAADSRPLRLPAAGAVLHRRALAGEAAAS